MKQKLCYLCKSKKYSLRPGRVRDAQNLEIRECNKCGLVFLSTDAHIDIKHYENSGMFGSKLPSIDEVLKTTSVDDNRRFETLKEIIVNKSLLDFGCGSGGFLIKARNLAKNVAGVELEKRVRSYWLGKLKIYGNLSSIKEKYDVITAFHVIEHLNDPRKTIRELLSILTKSGRLIIEVPSSDDALLTLYKCKSFQKFTYWSHHLYLFNSSTLSKIAKQAGALITGIKQIQRYPLSNHLYWLSNGKPGGHAKWKFFETDVLHEAYSSALSSLGKCDTILAFLEKKDS